MNTFAEAVLSDATRAILFWVSAGATVLALVGIGWYYLPLDAQQRLRERRSVLLMGVVSVAFFGLSAVAYMQSRHAVPAAAEAAYTQPDASPRKGFPPTAFDGALVIRCERSAVPEVSEFPSLLMGKQPSASIEITPTQAPASGNASGRLGLLCGVTNSGKAEVRNFEIYGHAYADAELQPGAPKAPKARSKVRVLAASLPPGATAHFYVLSAHTERMRLRFPEHCKLRLPDGSIERPLIIDEPDAGAVLLPGG